MPTCLRVNVVYVQQACLLAWFSYQRVSVPVCQRAINFACERAKWRVNFSTWCHNVPKSVPIFRIFLLRNDKGIQKYKKFIKYKKTSSLSEANVKTIRMGEQDGPITKSGVSPVTTLVFRKFCFSLRTSYKEMIWCTKHPCPCSYFSKALEFYLRMLFPCEFP